MTRSARAAVVSSSSPSGVDFAGSDSALADDELDGRTGALRRPRQPDRDPRLRLADRGHLQPRRASTACSSRPRRLAKIFAQKIKNWNDPAIAADNPDAKLPDPRISPVNRSDESGTTHNFTDWLSQAAPDVWTYPPDGNWPVKGGEAAEGTSGVVDAVKNGKGTIGYADESQARELGIAKIKVGSEFVAPSADAAAAVLDKSKESTDPASTCSRSRSTARRSTGTYPVTLVSYQIACTKYDDGRQGRAREGVVQLHHQRRGSQAAARRTPARRPISDTLRQQIQPAVDAIGSGT